MGVEGLHIPCARGQTAQTDPPIPDESDHLKTEHTDHPKSEYVDHLKTTDLRALS